MKKALTAAAAASVLILAGCASSESEPVAVTPAPVLDSANGAEYTGVAALSVSSNCTGTVIDTGVDSAPAYVLSNGHCLGMDGQDPSDVLIDEEGYGEVTFFYFHDTPGSDRLIVEVARLEYATMYSVDVGVLRLDATLGELKEKGIKALPLDPGGAKAGTKVTNIAVPVDGVEVDDWALRKGDCKLGKPTDVIEFRWLWHNEIANDCPGVLGGSSGSPLIADGKVVSMINTTSGGVSAELGKTCYLGQPCQLQGDSVKFVQDTAYGVDLDGVEGCFADGIFTLGEGCSLPTDITPGVFGGGTYSADGTDTADQPATISLTPPGEDAVTYLVKTGLASPESCMNEGFFDDAQEYTVAAGDSATIDVTLPEKEGFEFACVGSEGADPAVVIFSVDTTPPAEGPQLSITRFDDGAVSIDPLFDMPEIVDIQWLTGPPDSTDCADLDLYQPYFRQALMVTANELPLRVCAVGFDLAGNESPVTDQVVTADGEEEAGGEEESSGGSD